MIESLKNLFRLFTIKRDETIYTCIQNGIPLTKQNIAEVKDILKQKQTMEILKTYKKSK